MSGGLSSHRTTICCPFMMKQIYFVQFFFNKFLAPKHISNHGNARINGYFRLKLVSIRESRKNFERVKRRTVLILKTN